MDVRRKSGVGRVAGRACVMEPLPACFSDGLYTICAESALTMAASMLLACACAACGLRRSRAEAGEPLLFRAAARSVVRLLFLRFSDAFSASSCSSCRAARVV